MTAFARWYFVEAGWVWFVIVSAAVIAAWCAYDIWRTDRKHREALPNYRLRRDFDGNPYRPTPPPIMTYKANQSPPPPPRAER